MSHHNLLTGTPSIPLHCNICPKQPDFSDVSHLLTHVASKGHLSYYYKMKVKASTDPASKLVVDGYDEWYDEWRVEDLMMERMNQKEKKKNSSNVNANGEGVNSRRGSAVNSNASSRNASVAPTIAGRRSRTQRESTLDPLLGTQIKVEPKSRSGTPASGVNLDAAAINRSYAPLMQSWPTTPYGQSPVRQEASIVGSVYSTPSSDSEESESPGTYTVKSKQRETSRPHSSFSAETDAPVNDTVKDTPKLKGVLFAGMGMFDAATPDMRRKRNQKKATSVVELLQATSEIVEATELIFDAEGDLRRERPITGNPESDDGRSPLKGESSPEPEFPPKKKVVRKPRQPLKEKNVNTGRVTRRRGESHHPPFNNRKRKLPYFDGPDEDDDLTYGATLPKRRTNLSIHRDNSGPEITFDRPAPFSSLTAPFRNPFQTGPAQITEPVHQRGFLSRAHSRQPSLPYGPVPPSFRSSTSNPLSFPPPPNFGSFGQLSGHNMFQNNNPFAIPPPGHQAFTAFQQNFTVGPPPFGNETHGFHGQSHGQSHAQNSNPWDIFGFGPPDLIIPTGADIGFPTAGDFSAANPLFFSSTRGGLEDDEATVSAPASDR